jgi:dihydroorotase
MERLGMPLLLHGEVTDPDIDIFDREAVFIDRILTRLARDFPGLPIVFEHVTTEQAVAFVTETSARIAATITPHHLEINRNAIFQGGIRPHMYCLPVAKRERHRLALRRAATSGSAKFFLGTDSAPHAANLKEAACGCAGIFNAPAALETYVRVFDEEGALDKFEGFAAVNGPRFYGLPLNERRVSLVKVAQDVPPHITAGIQRVVPYHAGESIPWRFKGTVDDAA